MHRLFSIIYGLITLRSLVPAAPEPPAGTEVYTINMTDDTFTPYTLTINHGEAVTWRNMDNVFHTVTANGGQFNSSVSDGESYTYTFDTPGYYAYHCEVHLAMRGVIVVKAAENATAEEETNTTENSSMSNGGY